jgi:hypothetical protein
MRRVVSTKAAVIGMLMLTVFVLLLRARSLKLFWPFPVLFHMHSRNWVFAGTR